MEAGEAIYWSNAPKRKSMLICTKNANNPPTSTSMNINAAPWPRDPRGEARQINDHDPTELEKDHDNRVGPTGDEPVDLLGLAMNLMKIPEEGNLMTPAMPPIGAHATDDDCQNKFNGNRDATNP